MNVAYEPIVSRDNSLTIENYERFQINAIFPYGTLNNVHPIRLFNTDVIVLTDCIWYFFPLSNLSKA